jgi:hypothetical protein
MNQFMTISLFVPAAQIILVLNFCLSVRRGKPASGPGARARSVAEPLRPAHGGFTGRVPTVYRGPYEYAFGARTTWRRTGRRRVS